ncbi:microsomal triglyceride transfer protein large subunit-like [Daphnia pulex]|uniref:microsomal triglyceride transfer protein large subunit-like n=1 Tax=Daphnia pulex TaxID=6669 RepID=UPI001EDEC87F|nr:microsomal triglyceride transfer protein large subunit-like [Daphnia pulex]
MIQPGITLLLILAVFSSICQQAPATSTRQYELGTTYNYHYTAAVLLNEAQPLFSQNSTKTKGTDVGYQVAATVELTPVWQNPSNTANMLFELLMSNPKLSIRSRKAQQPDGFVDHSSPLDDTESTAVYIDWNDGKISNIYAFESESISLVNFKKGIASLFQLQTSAVELNELDASGSCTAAYTNLGGRSFLKIKNDCQFQRPTTSFAQAKKILGLSSVSSYQTKYSFKSDSDVVDTLTSTEVHSIRVNLRSQAGASVVSRQYLRLNGESKSKKKISAVSLTKVIQSVTMNTNVNLVEDNLQLVEESSVLACETSSCKNLKKAVNEVRKNLQTSKVATSLGASAFVTLLPVVRQSSKDDILVLLKDSKNKQILPQLIDVVAAAQTAESYAAALEAINFQSENIDLAERFLQVVSLSTRPSEYLLGGLLKLSKKIKSEKLSETALLSLAAITKTFVINQQEKASDKLVKDITTYFTDNLKTCASEDCNQLYMRVFKNLGSPETLPIILTHIDSQDKKTSVWAVKALKALPASVFLDDRVKQKLEIIYFQVDRPYDSSARTLALDMLLDHQPDSTFLINVLISLSMGGSENLELNTYSLQRLQEYAGNDPVVRSQLKQILSDRPSLNNYHVFAQNGMSTTFSRDLYRNVDGNGSFSSSTEAANKMMKRAAFDVYLRNPEDTFQLLSVGLFTGGMGSLMGFSTEGDEEEPTAGMEVTLAGVQLRPVIFFSGQSELMGHVWSGTASERTTALQATVLLQDYRNVVPLQSGFVTTLDVRGSVSFDFGGEIQISIWNRNSHSVVEDIAAWELEGSLNLNTPFVKSSVDFTVGAESRVDFVNDVSFANGILLCLRMGQAEFNIDYTVQKRESIPGTKHWIHKKKKRQDFVPGRTFKLNDQNSGFCNEMFPAVESTGSSYF